MAVVTFKDISPVNLRLLITDKKLEILLTLQAFDFSVGLQ